MEEIKTVSTILRRKIKIYVDITLKDDFTYGMGQRLVSFFGQASIFENTESITEDLEEFFELLSLNFLTFDDENNFENDIFSSMHIFEKVDTQENILIKNTLFLPILIFFYYTDKRTDFFILSSFKKRYFINVYKWMIILNYLKLKEKKINVFSDVYYLNNAEKYFNNINFLRNFTNSKYTDLVQFTTTTFTVSEEKVFSLINDACYDISKRFNKFSFFKNYRYKAIRNSMNLIKKLASFPIQFLLNLVSAKISFLDEDFEYDVLLDNMIHFVSQLYINKRTIFRRLRRRKRFKKKISRNMQGNKVTYYKIYAYIHNNKKKKKR